MATLSGGVSMSYLFVCWGRTNGKGELPSTVNIEKDLLSMMQSESKALWVSGSRQWNWLLQIQRWIIKSGILGRQDEGASPCRVPEEGGDQIWKVWEWTEDPWAAFSWRFSDALGSTFRWLWKRNKRYVSETMASAQQSPCLCIQWQCFNVLVRFVLSSCACVLLLEILPL